MAQTTINIRMDEGLKKQAESLFAELGMTISTAFNVFVRQTVRQRKIPFEISAESDPFYGESNMQVLLRSIKEADQGRFIVKTIEELEAMEK
jgi:DNA-damage-inducible protein J